MPTLYKRSNGIYHILSEDGGKRRWKTTGEKRKQEALEALVSSTFKATTVFAPKPEGEEASL